MSFTDIPPPAVSGGSPLCGRHEHGRCRRRGGLRPAGPGGMGTPGGDLAVEAGTGDGQ